MLQCTTKAAHEHGFRAGVQACVAYITLHHHDMAVAEAMRDAAMATLPTPRWAGTPEMFAEFRERP